ncbi:MAG: metal-sulfur cluster assembly factor [Acidimicrobiales bacterium]|nr:metal-sulfur cluster assembly factor [Acidimicrobiales bacterium]
MTEDTKSTTPVAIGPIRTVTPVDNAVEAAWDALRCVYDPELYLDVVSLGLIYDIRENNGDISVDMTLTTEGCPASESLSEAARMAISERLGKAVAVEVNVVWDPPWSPALIDKEAAAALGFKIR